MHISGKSFGFIRNSSLHMVSVLFVKITEVVIAEPIVTPTPIQIKNKIQLIFNLIFCQLLTAC
jgi:hypothetical protein